MGKVEKYKFNDVLGYKDRGLGDFFQITEDYLDSKEYILEQYTNVEMFK